MTDPLHEDEFLIDLSLVRALVDRALPECASLPLSPLGASGSSNALFRLGDELLIRLPRQPGGSATIEKEAHWLPQIGPLLPVSVPEVVAAGEPGLGYPERWSVVRWLEGDVPTVVDPASRAASTRPALARDLAAVVTALHDIQVPDGALADPQLRWYRGAPLGSMDDTTRHNVAACRDISGLDLDLDAALRIWEEAIALPETGPGSTPRWYHGDLLAENETSWLRGRAWALSLALITFPYYWSTMPDRCASRLAVTRSVLADAASTAVPCGSPPPR